MNSPVQIKNVKDCDFNDLSAPSAGPTAGLSPYKRALAYITMAASSVLGGCGGASSSAQPFNPDPNVDPEQRAFDAGLVHPRIIFTALPRLNPRSSLDFDVVMQLADSPMNVPDAAPVSDAVPLAHAVTLQGTFALADSTMVVRGGDAAFQSVPLPDGMVQPGPTPDASTFNLHDLNLFSQARAAAGQPAIDELRLITATGRVVSEVDIPDNGTAATRGEVIFGAVEVKVFSPQFVNDVEPYFRGPENPNIPGFDPANDGVVVKTPALD